MVNDCRKCEHYELICDGYGMCMKDAIGVMVIDDYHPTKNYMQCKKENEHETNKT